MEMMTELGVSHLSEDSGDFNARYTPDEQGNGRGSLCADVVWVENATAGKIVKAAPGTKGLVQGGGFKITSIIRGDDWCHARSGPLARLGTSGCVSCGDVIIAINARRLSPSLPPDRALAGCEGTDVLLTVLTSNDPRDASKRRRKQLRKRERRWRDYLSVAHAKLISGTSEKEAEEVVSPLSSDIKRTSKDVQVYEVGGGRKKMWSDKVKGANTGGCRLEGRQGKQKRRGKEKRGQEGDPRGNSKAERRTYEKQKAKERRKAAKEKTRRSLGFTEFGMSHRLESDRKNDDAGGRGVAGELQVSQRKKREARSKEERKESAIQVKDEQFATNSDLVKSMGVLSILGSKAESCFVMRTFRVRAVSRLTELGARYRDWVTQKTSFVSKLTERRCAYVHVPDMDRGGFVEFHRQFLLAAEASALIVDVRGNFGGYVSELLLEKLQRRRLAVTKPRYGKPELYPSHAPGGIMVMVLVIPSLYTSFSLKLIEGGRLRTQQGRRAILERRRLHRIRIQRARFRQSGGRKVGRCRLSGY